jgi:hypothetical protein
MRRRVLALGPAACLVMSGLVMFGLALPDIAAAQDSMMMNQMPAQAHEQFTGMPPPLPTRQERYRMKILSLRDKTLRMKAKDGGQLTPEHAASLQHELDELNKQFGIKAG